MLVRQRVSQIARGDEAEDDADVPRIDPLLKTVRPRLLTIGDRVRQLPTLVHLCRAYDHPGEPLWHHLATREGRS